MKIFLGLSILLGVVVLYPLLMGAIYFLVIGGIFWVSAWILTLIYNYTVYPMMKTLSVIPVLGKPVAIFISFVIILVVSVFCFGLISFPLAIMTLDFSINEDLGWSEYPIIAFFKSIFGPLGQYFIIQPLGEPDPMFSYEELAVPITIGKCIFELPFMLATLWMSLWLPLKSFAWMAIAWGKVIF